MRRYQLIGKRPCPDGALFTPATLLDSDRNEEAQKIIATIPRDRLNPEERALIEGKAGRKP